MILTLQILGVLITMISVSLYAGFGITWLLRSRRLAALLPLLTPVIGLAALSAAGHALAYLPLGSDQTALPLLVLFTIINVVAWRQGARPVFPRRYWPVLLGSGVALFIALLPIYQAGYLTTIASSTDVLWYLLRAEYLQSHGMMFLPNPGSGEPGNATILTGMRGGLRGGDVFVLALLSSLLNLRPHLILSVLMACLHALGVAGLFALATVVLRLHRNVALAASLLLAPQLLLLWVSLHGFLSQAFGIAIWYAVLGTALLALRYGGLRSVLLAGLLLAALGTFYHFYLVYLVAIVVLAGGFEWVRRSRGNLARLASPALSPSLRVRGWAILHPGIDLVTRGVGMGIAALLTIPVAWITFVIQLRLIASLVSRTGNQLAGVGMPCFPHPGEIVGLANHSAACMDGNINLVVVVLVAGLMLLSIAAMGYGLARRHHWHTGIKVSLAVASGAALLLGVAHQFTASEYDPVLFQLPLVVATSLSLLSVWLMLYGVLRSAPCSRWLLAAIVIGLGVALWHQRFWLDGGRGFTYGYYKVVTLAAPVLVLIFVAGALQLAHDAGWQPPLPRTTLQRVALFLPLLCFITALVSTLTILPAIRQYALAPPTRELEQAVALVPDDEPLLIIDEGMWDVYMIDYPRVFHYTPSHFYPTGTHVRSPRLLRYALIGYPNYALSPHTSQHDPFLEGEPWFDRRTSEVLWRNERYTLVRRTDGMAAEVPLVLAGLQQPLDKQVVIELADDWLHVDLSNHMPHYPIFPQVLADTPDHLVLLVEGEAGRVLVETQHGHSTTHTLAGSGQEELVIAVEQPMLLQVRQQEGAPVTLLAVRVYGATGDHHKTRASPF